MKNLRSSGSGSRSSCGAFVRSTASPRAALVVGSDAEMPSDWPEVSGLDAADAQLGHALGWVCEVRAEDVLIINPLGEGTFKASVPELSADWLDEVRTNGSAAIYLLPQTLDDFPQAAVDEAAKLGPLRAASVRTAITDDHDKAPEIGRNDPCHCGSGKKFKQCHGAVS